MAKQYEIFDEDYIHYSKSSKLSRIVLKKVWGDLCTCGHAHMAHNNSANCLYKGCHCKHFTEAEDGSKKVP